MARARSGGTVLASACSMKTNTSVVKVRDIARGDVHEVPRGLSMLRVPYDFFHPTGAVRVEDGLATYVVGSEVSTGRVAPAALADAQPGERVLLQLPSSADGDWWLCEIQEMNGVAAS